MAAAEATVVLRGKPVRVREGDLILLHDHKSLVSRLVGAFNDSWSHVATVVAHENQLVAFSVYMPPDGLVLERIERFGSACYARMGIVRPRTMRTAAQTLRLRRAVAEVLRQHAANPADAYERGASGALECLHALAGMQPATEDRNTCAELAARLVRAAGAWPAGRSVSVTIPELARIVGGVDAVF